MQHAKIDFSRHYEEALKYVGTMCDYETSRWDFRSQSQLNFLVTKTFVTGRKITSRFRSIDHV